MTRRMIVAVLGVLATLSASLAQDDQSPAEDPIHDELRQVRDDMMAAFEKRDVDRMLRHVHADAVVTLQNAELCRGPGGVREFYKRMMEGDDREVKDLKSELKVDELSVLYGDNMAVAFGSQRDQFSLKGGMEFSLDSRWTATLVKEDGRWQIAAYHISTNMFDNAVSDLLIKWSAIKTGAVSLLVGLLLGVVASKMFSNFRGKRRTSSDES